MRLPLPLDSSGSASLAALCAKPTHSTGARMCGRQQSALLPLSSGRSACPWWFAGACINSTSQHHAITYH